MALAEDTVGPAEDEAAPTGTLKVKSSRWYSYPPTGPPPSVGVRGVVVGRKEVNFKVREWFVSLSRPGSFPSTKESSYVWGGCSGRKLYS